MDTRFPHSEPRALGFSPERLQRIKTALDAEIATGTLPGAVLAIARDGKLAYFESFGHLDPATRAPMSKDAIFSIASMTKPLVSVGALMLCEEGRLMANEPVAKYLPQLGRMQVAQCDGAATVAPSRAMTLEDLMRHTAGVSYGRGNTPLHARYPISSDSAASKWTGREFLEQLAALPLHYPPGASWEYSLGFDVLGLVIEAVTGASLARYLEERLFAPLAMRDTSFAVPPEKVSRYAKALPNDPLTREPQSLRDGTKPHKFDCGGGCAVSTASDYLRFAQMLLEGGTLQGVRILGRKTVEYMTSDHIGPEIDTTRLREYPNINGYGFGLGVAVRRGAGLGGMPSTAGEFHWAGSTGTYFWVDPAERLVVVFMAHAPGAIRYYHRQLLHALVLQALE
ncbi:MAG TPA: serine hydrolase domain-containing protein [Burkholderiales bacterium]|nr:serine hydrolase domain-containing protein [Burkholderiales bacterium]